MLVEQRVSALAIFADLHNIPTLAVAERISDPLKGYITFPGGKIDSVSQFQAMRDEVLQETGVCIPYDAKFRRIRNPIRFVLTSPIR